MNEIEMKQYNAVINQNSMALRDWDWHLIIRDMTKFELVNLIERIKAEYQIKDSQMLEIVKDEQCNNSLHL